MDNQINRILAIILLLHRRKKRRRKRLVWVDPVLQKRDELGAFHVLFKDLRSDESKFFDYFKMSTSSFDELYSLLKSSLQRKNSWMRTCIYPDEMLAVSIRYFVTGASFTQLRNSYRLGTSTIRIIVKDVCSAILSVLQESCLPPPSVEQYEKIALEFEEKANFPHCLGAMSAKRINLMKTDNGNSKTKHCLDLLAACDINYRFTYFDVNPKTTNFDSYVIREFSFWDDLDKGEFPLPTSKPLKGSLTPNVPYFFLGDEAFFSNTHLLRPYGGKHISQTKKVFNYRLNRARRWAESAFAILTSRYEVFHKSLNVCTNLGIDIVKACAVLHNFLLDRDGYKFEDTLYITGLSDIPHSLESRNGGRLASSIRNSVADYFLTEAGSVPWQLNRI